MWADYARTFAIACMVFGHVEYFGMNGYYGFWNRLQDLFCMPLFFFLSGFFAKSLHNFHDAWRYIENKAFQLLLPFVVCGLFYIFIFCPQRSWYSLFYCPNDGAHYGYWFLPVLFEMNLLFVICQIFVRSLRISDNLGKGLLVISIVLWGGLMILAILKLIPEVLDSLLTISRIRWNFPFFIMGYFVAQNGQLEKFLSKKVYVITTTIFIVLYIIREKFSINNLFFSYTLIFCAIQIICYLSHRYDSSGKEKFKGVLSYCGKRTLAIYVLHFFFIPKNIPWMNIIICPDGIKDANIAIELFVCGILAFIIIVIVLLIELIINESWLFRRIILGKLK